MISWQTVQSLLLFFGPWLLPKLLAWYRSIKNRPASQIKPLDSGTSYALSILFLSGLLSFLSTLPIFSPENIFHATQSRLHTSAGVLLTRLAALRPLTAQDEHLRTVFDAGGLDTRLLYILFGPSVVLHNPLATPTTDPFQAHLIYALPTLLAPHIAHLFLLGLATSPLLLGTTNPSTARLRIPAITAALTLCAAEIYTITTYSHHTNLHSTRATDLDFAHWKLRLYRGLGITLLDAALAGAAYLAGTGRAFVVPASASARMAATEGELERVFARARGMGILRNANVRDAEARRAVADYWVKEGEVMRDVAEDGEVLAAERNALQRLEMGRVSKEAEAYVDGILALAPGFTAAAASASGNTGRTL